MSFEDERARVIADCDGIIADCEQLIRDIEYYNGRRLPTPRLDCEDARVSLAWAKRIRQRAVERKPIPEEWVDRMMASLDT